MSIDRTNNHGQKSIEIHSLLSSHRTVALKSFVLPPALKVLNTHETFSKQSHNYRVIHPETPLLFLENAFSNLRSSWKHAKPLFIHHELPGQFSLFDGKTLDQDLLKKCKFIGMFNEKTKVIDHASEDIGNFIKQNLIGAGQPFQGATLGEVITEEEHQSIHEAVHEHARLVQSLRLENEKNDSKETQKTEGSIIRDPIAEANKARSNQEEMLKRFFALGIIESLKASQASRERYNEELKSIEKAHEQKRHNQRISEERDRKQERIKEEQLESEQKANSIKADNLNRENVSEQSAKTSSHVNPDQPLSDKTIFS